MIICKLWQKLETTLNILVKELCDVLPQNEETIIPHVSEIENNY